jgi:cold shock CspA family protein
MSSQQGVIFQWNEQRCFGFIRNEQGRNVFFRVDGIKPDWKQSRAWAFYNGPGLPVNFDILFVNGKGERARNVEPIFPLEEPAPAGLEGLREVSVVKKLFRDYGFVERPCGDGLFFHKDDVIPEFAERWKYLREGVPLYHGVAIREGRPQATCIELYSPEELVAPAEPEPKPEVLVSVPAQSELLSPKFKSLSLLEIMEKRKCEQSCKS